ncbi:MAG: trypsin-like serine protease [Verrucomicrobiota bacterium JB022]|nr:trypsin-like serine protease [Verrucomicrobiota bacterium JB022]
MDVSLNFGSPQRTVLAGDSNAFPVDSPTQRLDDLGAASPFSFVGSLRIQTSSQLYYASASAISPNWVLTAAHNVDYDDDGQVDGGLSIQFNLPDYGTYTATSSVVHPGFTGFNNPSLNDDLALLYFSTPLPEALLFPTFGSVGLGDEVTMVGFGRSGYGDLGYMTAATLDQRRVGENVLDVMLVDDEGSGQAELFEYDFDAPDTVGLIGGSLGNDRESMIGVGDSGGPLLVMGENGYEIVGVNTYLLSADGTFGNSAGGVLTTPYLDWISSITGIAVIPEPNTAAIPLLVLLCLGLRRWKHLKSSSR